MLCDSSVRLRNHPIVVKKYQQAFLVPLSGKAIGVGFILLDSLARFLVILSSLSFFPYILSLHYTIIGDKSIRDFSAPSVANVATGPNVINGDTSFELKPVSITMVQASPFCGKAHEDANAHLQHFFEICSTSAIKRVNQEAIRLRFFPFSLLRKAKQWFYNNRNDVDTWDKCYNAFLVKFFPMGKTNALHNKISSFQQLVDE